MDLDELIIAVFCLLDETVKAELNGARLRQRGPGPQKLSDVEVLTMEVVGAFLGLEEDADLFAYFRRHWAHFFPGLGEVHRTTFVRQAANLWKLKERLWMALLARVDPNPAYTIADSLPLAVCRFARAPYCERFRGEADYGYDWVARQKFYGFRLHALVSPRGLIHCLYLTPAHEDEKKALEDMTEGKEGLLLGDRNFWSPRLHQQLAGRGMKLVAPFKRKSSDPAPQWSELLSRLRGRIESVFSQLTERFRVKQVKAKKSWQLMNRLLRCVLSHTAACSLNRMIGNPPAKLALLLS